MFFAFSKEQFQEGMRSLGLEPDNTDAIIKLADTSGFILKTDKPDFSGMLKRQKAEMQEAIDLDHTGDGFIFYMFRYELANHEYTYTGEVSDALYALDLTFADINASDKLQNGLQKAIKSLYGHDEL